MALHRITELPRRLTELSGQPGPSGRKAYQLAVDGRIPAVQVNWIWHFDDADLPAIAAAFGLTVPDAELPDHTGQPSAALLARAA